MDLTTVDLFSGGGGGSLGLSEIPRVSVVAAADIDDEVREFYNRNLPVDSVDVDLTKESAYNRLVDEYGLEKDDIDMVVGCPPCQEFSSLQDTTPDEDGKRIDKQLNGFLAFVLKAAPKVVVFENVTGILSNEFEEYVDHLKEYLRKAGYGFKMDVLRTADYGVPQTRERVIGFGIKGVADSEIKIPKPTHGPPEEAKKNGVDRWVTVRDAIGDLPEIEAGEEYTEAPYNGHKARNHRENTLERIRNVPVNGGSRTDLPEDSQLACHRDIGNDGAGSSYGRMEWDSLGPTLTTRCTTPSSGRFIHPEQNRGITPREAARIMTFPDSYELPERMGVAERLIGNAVPPRFIETAVGKFLDEHQSLIEC